MERGSTKSYSSAASEKMERVGGRWEKMEGHFSTGQNPKWGVVPMEEEESFCVLERMEEDRMPKKTFTQELEGTRRRARPRKGWKEEVERDLQVLRVRRWRELVADRKKWRDIFRQAKTQSGL